ncbi:MAG TPA: HDOD domain-containing protein [Treponemataceae bacterium]|jgi:putative nucleotidyltransferase with HDIG domain|nr:MAG: HDOD domain-containing protein [Treponema sp.]HOC28773.1 HDOD domain-containing protein [Treponemataceae bacterium]HPX46880.1 HDOD domain-containing protein [Treponemataceae bacterium]HQL32697.1 HDOD domain-containing protein [Treponemataceae bacterium]
MQNINKSAVDTQKIQKATRMGVPLSITTYTLPHEIELYISEVLESFLEEINQDKLKDYLAYCINELTTNAKKANTKRVYFREKNLDINDPDDYEIGMKTFKEDTLSNINYYLQLQKEAGLYVKVILQLKGHNILVEIRNNAEMTKTEFMRVFDKIARSRQFTTLEEALSQVLDDSEGAGLGLVIMILMLKKVGLNDESYNVLVEKGETITRISVPLDIVLIDQINQLSSEIVKYIDTLPKFPENIARIEKLLNDPDSKLSQIALHISNDVSLTADLLKLVNSAAFALSKKCTSITEAVKMIGIRGIKNLVLTVGTLKVLGPQSEEQKQLWAHSYKAAFFSYNLARNFLHNRIVMEDAYVCGLLHDIGKIVFSAVHPDTLQKIEEARKLHGIPEKIFNTIISGQNHAEIGAALAEKWNFPQSIINSIRYHHQPEITPDDNVVLASTVCFADLLIHYLDNEIDYYQINPELLKLFNIADETQLQKIARSIEKVFVQESTR